MNVKRILIIAVSLLLILSFGCRDALEEFNDGAMRLQTEKLLDELIEGDYSNVYALMGSSMSEEEFAEAFDALHSALNGIEAYELDLRSYEGHKTVQDGSLYTERSVQYEMTSEGGDFLIKTTFDASTSLIGISLTPIEYTSLFYTGALDAMQGSNVVQWVFLLSNLLVIAFALIAVVDCLRKPIPIKALWIPVILLGYVTFGVLTAPGTFRTEMNFGWFTAYTAWIRYGDGTQIVRFLLPIGPIVYFSLRSLLLKRGNRNAKKAEPVHTPLSFAGMEGSKPSEPSEEVTPDP